jgi:hypothetical protein
MKLITKDIDNTNQRIHIRSYLDAWQIYDQNAYVSWSSFIHVALNVTKYLLKLDNKPWLVRDKIFGKARQ